MVFPISEPLFNEQTTAEFLGVTLASLRKWRWEKRGPAFIKLGRLIRYRKADLEAWLDRQTVRTEG